MSTSVSSFRRGAGDHFEPQEMTDPKTQRRLRGMLEQIDYTAFASNREVLARTLGEVDGAKFQRLAVAAANARAKWVAEALSLAESPHGLNPEEIARLTRLRCAYDELAEAYEAMRRMIERGYLSYGDAQD